MLCDFDCHVFVPSFECLHSFLSSCIEVRYLIKWEVIIFCLHIASTFYV